jgi:16S rRNA U1498 N3-methylase RsmE
MQRFYIPSFEKKENFILDDKDIFHQLVKVLRVRE